MQKNCGGKLKKNVSVTLEKKTTFTAQFNFYFFKNTSYLNKTLNKTAKQESRFCINDILRL